MEFYKPGTVVNFKLDPQLRGMINEVRISEKAVLYEIGRFVEQSYETGLFYEHEFNVEDSSVKIPIGFV